MDQPPRKIPPAALWLGASGAIPFIGLALAAHLLEPSLASRATFALLAYGAVILSFLGGVQWGFAAPDSQDLPRRLLMSVVPSLVGWAALFLTGQAGFLLLIIAFALVLLIDWQAHKQSKSPPWYILLRVPLTATVILCLIIGAAA